MKLTQQQILHLCHQFGPALRLPAGIDGARLMFAISGNESSFGANCTPRHEPAYDVGGRYAAAPEQAHLLARFGAAAACSYGPWQLLLCNCGPFTPAELQIDPEKCALAFVGYVNRYVLGLRKGATVEQIAEIYNSGRISKLPAEGVLRYVQNVQHYYGSTIYLTAR